MLEGLASHRERRPPRQRPYPHRRETARGAAVVECASFVAGPTGGMTLAQLGADVIRIDPRRRRRRPPPLAGRRCRVGPDDAESYYWASLNKGKRSVAVDMRSDEGRALVTGLIASRLARCSSTTSSAGGGWPTTRSSRSGPDLVHVRVQGYPDGRPGRGLHRQRRGRHPADHRERGRRRARQPRAARMGPGDGALGVARPCSPPFSTATAPAAAPTSSWRWPTSRWPGWPTSAGCRSRPSGVTTGRGTATTSTASFGVDSPARTASG